MPYWTYYHRDNQKNLDNDTWLKDEWESLPSQVLVDLSIVLKEKTCGAF